MSESESVRDFESVIDSYVCDVTSEEAHYYIPQAVAELACSWPAPIHGRVRLIWGYLHVHAGMSHAEITQAVLLHKGLER